MNKQEKFMNAIRKAIEDNAYEGMLVTEVIQVLIALMQADISRAYRDKEEYLTCIDMIMENIKKLKDVEEYWDKLQLILDAEEKKDGH